MALPERAWMPRAVLEDGYALFVGSLLIVAALLLLSSARLITGGLAGLALLLSYLLPVEPGTALMLLSIPFFLLGGHAMGTGFLLRTVIASLCLMVFSMLAPLAVQVIVLNKPVAAIAAGAMAGIGTLALARHGAGAGGLGLLFLWLERRHGLNPGKAQMYVDATVFAGSCLVIAPADLLYSALSTVIAATILILWQRPTVAIR